MGKKLSQTMREEFAELEEDMEDFMMHTEIAADEAGDQQANMMKAWNPMDKAYEAFKKAVKIFIRAQKTLNESAKDKAYIKKYGQKAFDELQKGRKKVNTAAKRERPGPAKYESGGVKSTFKQFFAEAKSDRTILGQIKLGKNDETDFWNAIGCVLEGSMSKKDEDHIVNDLMKRSKIFVTPILLKAIKKAMKGAPNDCIDKTELAAVKKVFDATKTPLQRTKDAMKAGKMPKRAGKNITEAKKTKIVTTEDQNHSHEGEIDDEGDGQTTKTLAKAKFAVSDHVHKISGADVKPGGKKKHSHLLKD